MRKIYIKSGAKRLKWTPLSKLDDNIKIWAGAKIRLYDIGLNGVEKSKDYYEYLISFIYDNSEYLQLVCLSQGKAGNIICVLKKDLPNHYSLGKELKHKMGVINTFIASNDCITV